MLENMWHIAQPGKKLSLNVLANQGVATFTYTRESLGYCLDFIESLPKSSRYDTILFIIDKFTKRMNLGDHMGT
jgi:hypothetical protein